MLELLLRDNDLASHVVSYRPFPFRVNLWAEYFSAPALFQCRRLAKFLYLEIIKTFIQTFPVYISRGNRRYNDITIPVNQPSLTIGTNKFYQRINKIVFAIAIVINKTS